MHNLHRREFIIGLATGVGVTGAARSGFAAQQQGGSTRQPLPEYRFGTVVAVAGQTVLMTTSQGPLTLYTAGDLRVWKGRYTADVLVLKPGDSVQVRCTIQPDGKFLAREIWANHVGFGGKIREVKGDFIQIQVVAPTGGGTIRTVRVDEQTVFEDGRGNNSELVKGRDVQLVGLALEDGTVRATWMVVYEGGRPLHLPADARIMPRTGPPANR
jgi:hypothetical protein